MKKCLLLVFVVVLLAGVQVRAQNCDCNITPYKPDPPCFNSCAAGILALVSLSDLINIIRLPESLARKIVEWPDRHIARSFEAYREILAPAEYVGLAARLNSLRQEELHLLRRGDGDFGAVMAAPQRARNAKRGEVSKTPSNRAELTYFYRQDGNREWWWKVADDSGRTIAMSARSYKTETECLRDIERIRNSINAVVRRQ